MADEIKLKAPTVEQQVVVSINGEEKLKSFADTLEKISNNKNLQKYWKTQQELINATTDAYNNFSKKASQDNAKELIKVTNALKAMAGTDLSGILPDFDKITKSMSEAQKIAGNIDSAFSVKSFKEVFESFEMLKAYDVDMENLFSHFGVSANVGELQKNVRALEDEVEKLTRRLSNAKDANEELRNEFENFKSGSGFADKLDELDNLKSEMSYIREQAEETFRQFLKLNNIPEEGYDRDGFYDDNRFREYFQNIQSGYMSASDAIQQFKREYSYLLEESFKTNNDTFGLEQLQAFSNKLDSIFRQVEETSNKINDIISNGVITKSVENLSVDSSLTDSQRSLFGNLLKDEESLKSITVLFQKLIEESNKTKNNELFNSEQLQQVLSVFNKIENSLSSLRSIISDVGDGDEFSPLLKMLNEIKEATSNIKLNFNLDLGNEVSEKLNQKVSQASARQLEAYRKLFSAMKGTGKTNKEMLKFFEPDEASVTELIGTYKGIIKRAEEQFKIGNSNIYKKYLGTEYDALKREITNAEKQLSRADNKRSENGIIGDLFGNTKDLSEVIEHLNKIVGKLDEISKSALEFKNIFKEGFNVTASVEEIDKLTSRVKELEDELLKIKLSPVGVDKSNILSENGSVIEQQIKEQNDLQDEIRETIALTNEYGEVIDVYRGTRGLIGNGNVSNRYHGGTFWTSNRNLATQSYADGNKVTHANLYMQNPYLVHGGGAEWDQLVLSIKQGEELEKHLETVYTSINDIFTKIQNTSGIEAGHLFDVFNGQLNFTDFENGIQKPIESLKDFQSIFESIDYDGSKIPQVQNYINQLYDLFTSYSRISELSEKGILNTNEITEIAKALKYDGVVFKGIFDGIDEPSDVFVTFEEKQSKVIDMITAAQLRAEEEQSIASMLVDTRKNFYETLKSLSSEQIDSFVDKSAFNFVTDGSYIESLGEVLRNADPTESIDNIKNKIREYINDVVNEFENAQKQISSIETPIKDVIQGDKIDQATTFAKELDKTLEQVNIPTDSFDEVLSKLDLTKSELKEIVKITKQSVSDSEGKFHDSYTLKDKFGSTEIYGLSSNTEKGQLLRSNIVQYDSKNAEQDTKVLLEVERQLIKEAEQQTSAQQKKWKAFQQEQTNYEKTVNEVNNAISKTDELLNKLQLHEKLDSQFLGLLDSVDELNSKLKAGEISVSDYNKSVKSLTSEYSKLVTVQQNRDMETYKQNAKATEQEAKAVKEVWDKNVKAIQDYMDAVTKLNNLKAQDKGTGTKSSQIALQEKNVEELKEKALDARAAITSMVNPHDVPIDIWRDWLDVMKKFDQASLGSAESVAKLEDALRNASESNLKSMKTSLQNYEGKLSDLSVKPDDAHRFPEYQAQLDSLNNAIQEYRTFVDSLQGKGIIDESDIAESDKLKANIEKLLKETKSFSSGDKGYTELGADKVLEKINSILEQNSAMSREAKAQIKAYYNEILSGNPSRPLNEILDSVYKIVQAEREAGRAGQSWLEIFNTKKLHSFLGQAASMFSFYDIINVARQAGQAVIDLNTNITELAKVSEASASQIYDDFNSYADITKEVGGTISDTISATADWSRNGYNIPDAKELAEVAMIYKNVGDGINIDQANEYLISTLRGFKLEAKDAMDIIDSINEVANNEPISSAGIGEALQRSAAAFNVANTSLQESIALVTSTNSVLQSPEKVGSMWTTVSARIRGAKTELEDAGLETDGMVESTSKLQAMIKGMTGFDILEDDQKTFKSIYDIIIGIGEEFQNLSGVDQAALLEALAGKRQSNALAATLNNIDLLKKAYGEATNAEGSAMAEQEKYQRSIQYSIDRTKASLEELANDFISSDFLKGSIDSGDKLINILDLLIDKFGVLGTAAGIGGIVASFKGAGRVKIAYPHLYTYACRNKTLYA